MRTAYCPECGTKIDYERGYYLLPISYLRFCSKTCMDEFMEDKTVLRGFMPEPRDDPTCICVLSGKLAPPGDCPVHKGYKALIREMDVKEVRDA